MFVGRRVSVYSGKTRWDREWHSGGRLLNCCRKGRTIPWARSVLLEEQNRATTGLVASNYPCILIASYYSSTIRRRVTIADGFDLHHEISESFSLNCVSRQDNYYSVSSCAASRSHRVRPQPRPGADVLLHVAEVHEYEAGGSSSQGWRCASLRTSSVPP